MPTMGLCTLLIEDKIMHSSVICIFRSRKLRRLVVPRPFPSWGVNWATRCIDHELPSRPHDTWADETQDADSLMSDGPFPHP